MESLGFSTDNVMSSSDKLPTSSLDVVALAGTVGTELSKNDESGRPCLVLVLEDKLSAFHR